MSEHGIICEMNFFKSFCEYYRNSDHSLESRVKDMNWLNLYESMLNSRLSFDCDWATLYAYISDDVSQHYSSNLNNCPSFKLIKSLMDKGTLEINCTKQLPDSLLGHPLSNSDLMSIFLIDDDCKVPIADGLGVHGITSDSYLFSDNYKRMPKNISQSEDFDWKSVLNKIPNQNSVLIMDRYIACTPSAIKYNLFPIIDSLLPDFLSIPFHLTIMTLDNDKFDHHKFRESDFAPEIFDPDELERLSYGEKLCQIIEKYIKSKNKDLQLYLSVYICDSENFHDRIILTNSIFVYSGAGFNLRKWKSNKVVSTSTTTINISIRGICDKNDTNILNNYYALAQNIAEHKIPIYSRENCTNRLFIRENN